MFESITTGNDSIGDERTVASIIPDWRLTGDDTGNSVAQAVAPDTSGTCVSPASPDGADVVTETS